MTEHSIGSEDSSPNLYKDREGFWILNQGRFEIGLKPDEIKEMNRRVEEDENNDL